MFPIKPYSYHANRPHYGLKHYVDSAKDYSGMILVETNLLNGVSDSVRVVSGGTAVIDVMANYGYIIPESLILTGTYSSYTYADGILTVAGVTAHVTATGVCTKATWEQSETAGYTWEGMKEHSVVWS